MALTASSGKDNAVAPSERFWWLGVYLENKDVFSFMTKIGSRRLFATAPVQMACHQYLIAGSLYNLQKLEMRPGVVVINVII